MIKAQINLKTIRRNIKTVRTKLNGGVRICAVLKANAYGLGDTKVAQGLEPHVEWFAAAKMCEALRLREAAGVKKPVLLFGICENRDLESAIKHQITVTAGSISEMRAISKKAAEHGKIYVHIKVNTGMNRYGITSPWQLKNILTFAEKNPDIIIGGLYTHMSHETDNTPVIDKQLKRFMPFRAMMKRAHPRAIIHAACSGSAEYPPAQFDMVRIGKAMYGGFNGYKTALTVTSKICAVRHIRKGEGINYNHKFTAAENITAGIVSCGYADLGYLNNEHVRYVYIGKTPCKILGVICMDTFAVDVTNIAEPLGKTVTVLSPLQNSIADFVKASGITACRLLCSLNFSRTKVKYV